jgi:hypothetical protein
MQTKCKNILYTEVASFYLKPSLEEFFNHRGHRGGEKEEVIAIYSDVGLMIYDLLCFAPSLCPLCPLWLKILNSRPTNFQTIEPESISEKGIISKYSKILESLFPPSFNN